MLCLLGELNLALRAVVQMFGNFILIQCYYLGIIFQGSIFWDSIFRHKYSLKSANVAVKAFLLLIVMRCT